MIWNDKSYKRNKNIRKENAHVGRLGTFAINDEYEARIAGVKPGSLEDEEKSAGSAARKLSIHSGLRTRE